MRSLLGERTRFLLACIVAGLSLTVILPAVNLPIWVVTLLVTDWGHWLVMAPLLLLAWELWRGRSFYKLVTSVVCLIAAGLFLLPMMETIPLANQLPQGLAEAFGPQPVNAGVPSASINFRKFWWSERPKGIALQELHYTTVGNTSLPLDFYSDGKPGGRPCVIIVHGGAWHSGNEKELESWDPILAHLGYRVASIGYL
jgi:acetyl esterase/lipase